MLKVIYPMLLLLSRDIKRIMSCPNVIWSSDKTSNFYQIPASEYDKLLLQNITSEYPISSSSAVWVVNTAASIVDEPGIADRVEGFLQAQAVITYKDHKKDPGVKCRLLNGAKITSWQDFLENFARFQCNYQK